MHYCCLARRGRYFLGEAGSWRKFTNFEATTRVPLMIRAPWIGPSAIGTRSSALVELVDVMPTIADLAGVGVPAGEILDGVSLVPLLANTTPSVKGAAFSQYPRKVTNASEPWDHNSIIHSERHTFTHMGMTVRTVDWRLTLWAKWNGTSLAPMWNEITDRELYDWRNTTAFPTDFDVGETSNVASDPQHADVVEELSALLKAQFPG